MSHKSSAKQRFAQTAPLATLKQQVSPERLTRLTALASQRQAGLSVFMENVWNPHNLAAILRTADGFGIQHVHYSAAENQTMEIAGKETARTAHKWVDLHTHRPEYSAQTLADFKAQGWQCVASVATPTAPSLYAIDWTQYPKLMLLVGNEHSGLSATTAQAADIHITIPMRGMVTSFNVSVATALILGEIVRQRDASAQRFTVPDAEAEQLLEAFLRRALFKAADLG